MARELTHGEGHDLLEDYKRAWEARDTELVMSLFAPDAEYREDPFEDPRRGANAIRAMYNDIAAGSTNAEFDAERVWVSGRTVLASWHAAFTRRETAERIRVRGFFTFELDEEGLIERVREWSHRRVVGTDSTLRADERIVFGRVDRGG